MSKYQEVLDSVRKKVRKKVKITETSYECPKCSYLLGWKGINVVKYIYCPNCGQKLKWEFKS